MKDKSNYAEIQNRIMQNEKQFSTGKKGWKLFVYNFLLCLVNRYNPIINKNIFVVNGKAELKFQNQESFETLYYSIIDYNFLNYFRLQTHVSNVKPIDRLHALCKALVCNSKMPLGYRFDFFLWDNLIATFGGKMIANSGHFDRLSTQISLLSASHKVDYCMKQHGLIGYSTHVPCKLIVKQLCVFDENEQEKFRKYIVANKDCKYRIEYKSSVSFRYTEKENIMIGVIEQPIIQMQELLNVVASCFPADCITVMMHPLSNQNYALNGNNGITFSSSKEKELNYDAIFSLSSTLAYEYLKQGYDKPIIIYDCLDCFADIDKGYKNAVVCSTIDDFYFEVKKIACALKCGE